MLSIRIGLVDMTGTIDAKTMAAVAAALDVQVTRDLPQYWPVTANVSYVPDPAQVPQGVWPVQIVKDLPAGEGGFHTTKNKQPYAKVIATPGSDEWAVDASHETIEMLVDPYGNRLQTSTAIQIAGNQVQDAGGQFEYLVEACDPCEADDYTYQIDGFRVSDFITPHFYDTQATAGTRYSFTGAVERPRQILPGGYISYIDPKTNELQQILWVDPGQPPQHKDLGPADGASLRAFVEQKTHALVRRYRRLPSRATSESRQAYREAVLTASRARSVLYR
jgi:hypothetical protein